MFAGSSRNMFGFDNSLVIYNLQCCMLVVSSINDMRSVQKFPNSSRNLPSVSFECRVMIGRGLAECPAAAAVVTSLLTCFMYILRALV